MINVVLYCSVENVDNSMLPHGEMQGVHVPLYEDPWRKCTSPRQIQIVIQPFAMQFVMMKIVLIQHQQMSMSVGL